jgi:hydrogenase maturation protease
MRRVVVIGVGNPFRCDDGAGIVAARLLRDLVPDAVEVVEHDGEPATLLDAWEGAATAYVIDAVRADDEPGTIHRIELDPHGHTVVPASPRRDSSHALGLGDAVALARALGRLPGRLVLIGVTGRSFEAGDALAEPVRAAVERVVGQLAAEITAWRSADVPD